MAAVGLPGACCGCIAGRERFHAPAQENPEPFVQGEESVVSPLPFIELDILIYVAVVLSLAVRERVEYADAPCTQGKQFLEVIADDLRRVRSQGRSICTDEGPCEESQLASVMTS